ncbi:HlyD family type I secretion periplasmic adaptor subunit [Alteromonas sp. A081]|uniref:HlyD family type I secretion periplasmic adaptor subunit n=1 Tax=Alteromonadaceae TaxID=72275 RepID=UPI001C08F5E0|nr:HlyD family type I secretion periplasmic adaptor subunit [Aestuariibacter sp. A3R04]MBU3021936.1 HlyD family type I secretion periplasmic adaptor subunit [Aestuariibacter sp. A3R04]
MNFIKGLSKRWKERGKTGDEHFSDLRLYFLPAALEIQQKPPHPKSKLIARMLMALFSFGVIWACIGEVDIVATSEGQLIPKSRLKVIQPMVLGSVHKLHVVEGQHVIAGEVLIELETTQAQAELISLEEQLADIEARLHGFDLLTNHVSQLKTQTALDTSSIATAHHYWVVNKWADYTNQMQLLEQQIATQQHKIAASEASNNKLSQLLPIMTERAQALKSLSDKQVAARLDFLAVEQERIAAEQDLQTEQKSLAALKSELSTIKVQLASLKSKTLTDISQQKLDLLATQSSLSQQLTQSRDLLDKQTLRSPVNGVVKNLAITTIGAVVTAADELMTIVPTGDEMEVEAFIENKDIGFVHEGQSVEVKVNTFNFTKYGVIEGELKHISDDAIEIENKGLVFPARVKLSRQHIMVNQKRVNLQPGMSVTAEIKTGKRRLIEFFMSPLLRNKAESMRER